MRLAPLILPALAVLSALFLQPSAQAKEDGETEKEVSAESPDGKFAFLKIWEPTSRTCDLIEKASGKVLLRAAESEEDSNRLSTEMLWRPDSQFVALMISTTRRSAWVAVFAKQGATFREIKLPDMPEAEIPKKSHKPGMDHIVEIDWSSPSKWRKDGSLEVTTSTTIDGAGSVTATRTTVLAFDKKGRARIVRTSQEVEENKEE